MEKVAKKVFASVSDQLAEKLNKRAEIEGRSLSNLIGYLLEREMDTWQLEQQKPSPTEQTK